MTGLPKRVAATYGDLAGRWDTSGAQWNQPVAARLVQLAGLTPGMDVLDAGCGAGAASIPAARAVAPGGTVAGIDVAEPMLARARRDAAAAGVQNITFGCADAAAPPLPAGSLDAVLASMVLYLLPDPAAALEAWRVLLRPGGVVAFSWVIAEDPAWEPVFDAVDAFLPGGQETWADLTRRPPWNSPATVEALLPAGYSDITTTAEPVTTTYHSPQHWWESSWSQAPRLTWQHIPQAARGAARDAAFTLLEPLRGPGGTFPRTRTTGYTTTRITPP